MMRVLDGARHSRTKRKRWLADGYAWPDEIEQRGNAVHQFEHDEGLFFDPGIEQARNCSGKDSVVPAPRAPGKTSRQRVVREVGAQSAYLQRQLRNTFV